MKSRLLLLGLVLTVASAARGGTYYPVPITSSSYNQDVIIEKTATPRLQAATTASVDAGKNGGASTWMEQGFDPANPGNGLPLAGTVITAVSNGNYSFKMPPSYTAPNGILIDTVVTNGTFTVTTPAAYVKLSFLSSAGNGGSPIGVTVHHLDGSFETASYPSPDWFFGTSNVAVIANERCSAATFAYQNINSGNPRLYFRDITLTNTTSPVTSIDLYFVSGTASFHSDTVAVSGSTDGTVFTPIDVTGFTYDFIVEAGAAKRGRTINPGNGAFATTQSMDNDVNTVNTWYERGYNTNLLTGSGPISYTNLIASTIAGNTGLPAPGSTISNGAGDRIFTFASDYTTNDAIYLNPSNLTATATFASPTNLTALSFLGAAGNGPVRPVVVINYQDGSKETNNITVQDWFNTAVPFVMKVEGRAGADTAQPSGSVTNTGQNPRIFAADVLVNNQATPVTGIEFTYTNTGGRCAIFAIAGTVDPVAPFFVIQPAAIRTFATSNVTFTARADGTAPITYQWQKGTNGVYVNLIDGGDISGATSTNLSIANVDDADEADYQLVANNAAGTATSSSVRLTVLSLLTDVTTASDPISSFGGADAGNEGVIHAIDDLTDKWLNFGGNGGAPFLGPVGLVVSPAVGPTILNALRFYNANDASERDPMSYLLEGSNNGGADYAVISSNSIPMPIGFNAAGNGLDPLTQNLAEVDFANTNGYATYRLSITSVRNAATANSMQVGEIEFLGIVDPNPPPTVTTPPFARAYDQGALAVNATVTGNPTPASQWQKKSGPNFVDLTDGGNVSGSQTPNLLLFPVSFSDAGEFRIVVSNTVGSITSAVVVVSILTTNTDVTQPSDLVTDFGDQSAGFYGAPNPGDTIDNTFTAYLNGGSGINAAAGFPPFAGPVGVIITHSAGSSVIEGIRFYAGEDPLQNDPADFLLEGSSNGGASYTTLASGLLSIPSSRNQVASPIDPLTASMQEILFVNSTEYTSYRITVTNIVDNPNSSALLVGEVELLGTLIPPAPKPTFSSAVLNGGNLELSGTNGTPFATYYVLTTTDIAQPLSNWISLETNTFDSIGGFTYTNSVTGAASRFFSIQVP